MIVTKTKDIKDILKYLNDFKKILLIGCSECASVCKSGGDNELKIMENILKENGKIVIGSILAETGCHIPATKRDIRKCKDIIYAEAILVLSCGAGVQTISEIMDIPVYPALDTLFIGNIKHLTEFDERCSACGDCYLGRTGGICPITRCPKEMVNGPCGGMKYGKCEIDSELPCAWILIYERLKKNGKENILREIYPPKDYSKKIKPAKLSIRNKI
jgi:ferredoxin